MTVGESEPVTPLLEALRAGDGAAKERLVNVVYAELHRQAVQFMQQERADHTLQPTALLHEAFIRLFEGDALRKAPNRAYVFGAAVRAMREVLADHARRRAAKKHGLGQPVVPLDAVLDYLEERNCDVLGIHAALDELAQWHERQSQVVTLRFFGGFTVKEVADQLQVSVATVESDFRVARAWLRKQLGEHGP